MAKTPKPEAATDASLAERLCEAHVAHALRQLEGAPLAALIEAEVDAALKNAARLRLDDVVTRQMIKDTARTYAAELQLGGGVPELVGEIGRALFAHPVQAQTRIGELLPDKLFVEALDKLLEMDTAREKLIVEVVGNPIYSALVSDLLYHGIKDYLADSPLARNIPGAQTLFRLGRSAMDKATPNLELSIEQGLKKYIGRNIASTLKQSERFLLKRIGDGQFRDAALDAWEQLRDQPLSLLRDLATADDIEDAFVLGYEAWLALRKGAYYRTLIDAGIDCFFDKYGKSTLAVLLADIGVTRTHMVTEGLRYGPHVLGVLRKKKLLEPIIRRQIEPFYRSAEASAILASR